MKSYFVMLLAAPLLLAACHRNEPVEEKIPVCSTFPELIDAVDCGSCEKAIKILDKNGFTCNYSSLTAGETYGADVYKYVGKNYRDLNDSTRIYEYGVTLMVDQTDGQLTEVSGIYRDINETDTILKLYAQWSQYAYACHFAGGDNLYEEWHAYLRPSKGSALSHYFEGRSSSPTEKQTRQDFQFAQQNQVYELGESFVGYDNYNPLVPSTEKTAHALYLYYHPVDKPMYYDNYVPEILYERRNYSPFIYD